MKKFITQKNIEITTDGATIWVFKDNNTIARFGKLGIDIHCEGQSETECLFCTHSMTTKDDFFLFQKKMKELYKIEIPGSVIPNRFKQN